MDWFDWTALLIIATCLVAITGHLLWRFWCHATRDPLACSKPEACLLCGGEKIEFVDDDGEEVPCSRCAGSGEEPI